VDEWIENLRTQKENLEFYKKGMMQKIFPSQGGQVPKVRFKDDDGNDFAEWEEKKLGEVCEKRSSGISANSLDDNYGEYKIYGANGKLKKVDFYQQNKSYISIVKDGAGVGRILICEPKTSVLGTLDIIKPKEHVNLYFLYSLLARIKFKKYTIGSTIPHIYFKDYKKEKIQIPSFPEQQKIAEFLTSIDNLINLKQQQITQAEQWKKGLMQGLFV
jgi:type I restriction enzyme S subunit